MRSRSMQSLTDGIKRRHPGVVVYGKGDDAHRKRRSSHNEDDTPGSLPEQEDADRNPEHRAIDVMLGPVFTRADAYELIGDLLADPAALARLMYILFNGWRWSRNTGWERVEFGGDPHDDHIHFTGDADDDENAAPWAAVEGDDMDAYEKAALRFIDNRLAAIVQGLDDVAGTKDATQARGEDVWLVRTLKQLAKDVAELKARPAADVDEAALAAALAPLLDAGATPTEVAAAVRAELDKTRLVGG